MESHFLHVRGVGNTTRTNHSSVNSFLLPLMVAAGDDSSFQPV